MIDPLSVIMGPLVLPECRRALGRGWLIWLRALAALAVLGTALGALWYWWIARALNHSFMPAETLRGALLGMVGICLAMALIMAPAVLAGSVAGEKERGTLGLLLSTRVTSREIVAGRLAGKLSQVLAIFLAGVPGIVLIAALAGLRPAPFLAIVALPLVVMFGCGGLAIAASTLSRRGRDALLVVYLIEAIALLASLAPAVLPPGWYWLGALNPYLAVRDLVWTENIRPVLGTMAFWFVIGLAGVIDASVQLRPACLRLLSDGATVRRGRRNLWVPPVAENPMLWKELHIERAGSLGHVGKWLGLTIIALLFLGSTIPAALQAWWTWVRPDFAWANSAQAWLVRWIADQAETIGILIELAIGLRASVAIAAERDKGTWDGLLSSPLEGRDIVRGKVWGSMYGLRWLFVAAFWAWSLALASRAMSPGDYCANLAETLVASAFIAAVGLRVSLATSTATRAMTATMALWLAAAIVLNIIAALAAGLIGIVAWVAWIYADQLGLTVTRAGPWVLLAVTTYANPPVLVGLYLGATALVLGESRLRFDRLAGRMAGGEVAVTVSELLHGRPMLSMPDVEVDQDPDVAEPPAAVAHGERASDVSG